MRHLLTASTALVVTTLAGSTLAAEPINAKEKPEKPEVVLARDGQSPGSIFQFGAGVRYLGGGLAKDVGIGTFEATFAFYGGYYFTPRFGVVTGVEAGFGFLTTGCTDTSTGKDSTKCGALSARVPILAQYAFQNRNLGPYLEGGVTAGNIHLLTANPSANSSQSLFLVSPLNLSLGGGARFAMQNDPEGKRKPFPIDFNARVDVGQFMYGAYAHNDSSASGEIPIDKRAFHVGVTLGLAAQW